MSKTEEELLRIGQMLKQNFMFQHLEPVQREQIFKVKFYFVQMLLQALSSLFLLFIDR